MFVQYNIFQSGGINNLGDFVTDFRLMKTSFALRTYHVQVNEIQNTIISITRKKMHCYVPNAFGSNDI